MDIRVAIQDVTKFAGDALVVNLFEGTAPAGRRGRTATRTLGGATAAVDAALRGAIGRLIAAGELTGKRGELTLVHTHGMLPADRVLVLGLGKPEECTPDRVRTASADAVRRLRKIGARRVGTIVHGAGAGGLPPAQAAQALAEGAVLGAYRFLVYKPEEKERLAAPTLTILDRDPARRRPLTDGVRRGLIVAEATNRARDLVNEPGNVLTPTELARRARAQCRSAGVACEVLGPPALRRLKAGGLLGVARGSQEPPCLILLRHRGGRRGGPHLGLVGKGITFDSGGISIKPAEHMEAMKGDMAGAAAVLAAVCAIARLGIPLTVTGVIPAAENLPGGSALKPGDILRAMSGTTIEVINTDAEGRLILADALHLAGRRGATHLVDVATLTGACVVALGTLYSGAFGNHREFLERVLTAGREAGERLWPMPTDADYDELITSEVAEIKNTGGRKGGAITAAKFLQHFVGETPWVHLDIAGTAMADKESGVQARGGTGVMVRTLVTLAWSLAGG
ncbi:MAG: leucyl aminopeptidase [Candidatus Methylomirabilota bacterium]